MFGSDSVKNIVGCTVLDAGNQHVSSNLDRFMPAFLPG
ncbi:hypothetical protein SSYIS1_24590 [Serratia symbiotica]|uniref:Uncharacterized protein n=1 Tax=Serratia symbiotica TaxID=138074 RepID=A0A455VI24_9GAMM|nr:hypothetical protein SSYIS1_24590 [Serratia symbiotica]